MLPPILRSLCCAIVAAIAVTAQTGVAANLTTTEQDTELQPSPVITSMSAANDQMVLEFSGKANTAYTIEHSSDLTTDRFDPLDPAVALVTTDSSGKGVATLDGRDTRAFYRAVEGERFGKRGIGSNVRWGSAAFLRQALIDLEVSWFYHWGLDEPYQHGLSGPFEALPENIEWVPMYWGWRTHERVNGKLTRTLPWGEVDTVAMQADMDRIAADDSITHLLGVNEPDHHDQATMSVSDVIDIWPILESSGKRLGSPAPAGHNNTVGGWLQNFMNQCNNRGYRVDFICIHVYQDTPDLDYVLDYCEAVYEKYGLPIWITEWSLANWNNLGSTTEAEQVAYFKAVTAALKDVPYVERHAWFTLTDEEWSGNTWDMGMVDTETGELTPIGEAMLELNSPLPDE